MTQPLNKEVEVNAYYFRTGKNFETFPKQITIDNVPYSFVENGLRLLIHKGQEIVRLFDMTDGTRTFHLKNEAYRWVLTGTTRSVYGN